MSIYVSFVGCVMRLLVNAEKFGSVYGIIEVLTSILNY